MCPVSFNIKKDICIFLTSCGVFHKINTIKSVYFHKNHELFVHVVESPCVSCEVETEIV
jgi:hypothetical protein